MGIFLQKSNAGFMEEPNNKRDFIPISIALSGCGESNPGCKFRGILLRSSLRSVLVIPAQHEDIHVAPPIPACPRTKFRRRGGENRTLATRPPALCTAIILRPEMLVLGRTAIILRP